MAKANMLQKVGGWAFIIGVLLAIIAGVFLSNNATVVAVLVVLGLIVGFLNVTGQETSPFLMAAVSLVIIAYTGGDGVLAQVPTVGAWLSGVLSYVQAFVTPAAIVVALKAIYALAADQ